MLPEQRDGAHLWDMLEACRELLEMTLGVSRDEFLIDRKLLRATERCVEILGEAARRVSPEFQARHEEIPWRAIIGQRNILAHDYGQVDQALLFNTVTADIPALAAKLEPLLPPLDEE